MQNACSTSDKCRKRNLEPALLIGILCLFALLIFKSILLPGNILFSTDDNIGRIVLDGRNFPASFLGGWADNTLLGMECSSSLNWTNLLWWLLPSVTFANFFHLIDLFIASLFLLLFLRSFGLTGIASLMGAVAAFWLASNLTLTYAGHLAKFSILMLAAIYLWLIRKAILSDRSAYAVLAGGVLGIMFTEQPDVALFFTIFLGLYAFYAVGVAYHWQLRALARFILPIVGIALIISLNSLLLSLQSNVSSVDNGSTRSAAAKWEFATQWSWPPEECIDFIAPGYMGWRSGEPAGPYWGRMGRSAGWEQTGQGFMNFKLENQYIGAIPIILAVFAGLAALFSLIKSEPGGDLDSSLTMADQTKKKLWKKEILFWSAVAVITLLLSFGKHFPLYWLFFQLPVVSSIRNPNKFLQIFQIAIGILSAYGFMLATGYSGTETSQQQELSLDHSPDKSLG